MILDAINLANGQSLEINGPDEVKESLQTSVNKTDSEVLALLNDLMLSLSDEGIALQGISIKKL